MIANNEEGV